MYWCSLLECDDYIHLIENIQSLPCDMNYVVCTSVDKLDNDNKQFYQHGQKNLLITNEEQQHLLITVYFLLTPRKSLQFINQIMLIFGRYATDIDISPHGSIRQQSWNAKHIIMNDDK